MVIPLATAIIVAAGFLAAVYLARRGVPRGAEHHRLVQALAVGDFNRLVVGRCDCGCGVPRPVAWGELDRDGYMTAAEATAGHLALCERWARVPYRDAEEDGW